jgi:phosphomannomutase
MGERLKSFRTYDIRGVVPEDLNAEMAYRVGRCFSHWRQVNKVVVGRDARLSSPGLAEALIKGLCEGGIDVLDAGLVNTPMLNFAVTRHECHGLMITASHNPRQYNGIKVIDPKVEQIYYGRGLEHLETLVADDMPNISNKPGRIYLRPALAEYENHLVERFDGAYFGALSVVVDCSNGVGGLALRALERLGIQHRLLNHIPNGEFPNHGCDTLQPQNLKQLQEAVIKESADIGIMFDGDSDRVMFVDDRGEIAPLDLIFVLMARQILTGRKGRILYDLRFSRVVKEEVERAGGMPETMRVGNPFYKEALHNLPDALLAAELSGHIMFRENFGIDDPLYASLKLLEYLGAHQTKLSALLQPLQRYASTGELRIETDTPLTLVDKIRQGFGDGQQAELDGITVEYPDWWFNLRASNTEPVAKLVIEAASTELLTQAQRRILETLDVELSSGGGH